MKKTVLFLLAVAVSAGVALAQEPQTPEFKNTPMILKKDGSLEKLEKQTSEMKSKSAGGGFGYGYGYGGHSGSESQYIVFQGVKSPVRVATDQTFIVKLNDAETDPESVFYIQKAIPKKVTREIYLKKAGFMGGSGKSVKEQQVKLNYEKVSPGVYKVKPEGLEKGTEYGFVLVAQGTGGGQSIVYLFGTN